MVVCERDRECVSVCVWMEEGGYELTRRGRSWPAQDKSGECDPRQAALVHLLLNL